MTNYKHRKQARHNAAKEARKARLTVGEIQDAYSAIRRQEAEMEETFCRWQEESLQTIVPVISNGMMLAVLRTVDRYIVAGLKDKFLEDVSNAMQDIINDIGNEVLNEELIRAELEADGFDVPAWSRRTDEVKEGR